ncbi:21098_t:CDS:2 [Entrophospora sp. SA101]|nr:21098_t:CDS:2 [Entrophospora sp. SA101]
MSKNNLTGAQIIAKSLKEQGINVVFGIVGIPVVEVAEAIISEGIRFIGFHNEQSLSYAAGAYGYLTGRPGVCLVVSGPGVVHAMAGVMNAKVNCWPLLLLGGSSDIYQEGMGAFQELDQVTLCQPNTKYSARPTDPKQIPNIIDKAIKFSIYGRPGPVYVDLPANFIQATIDISSSSEAVSIKFPKGPIDPPKSLANTDDIIKAVQLLQNAKSPLIIIGKGASYSRAEKEINQLIEHTNIPFLPTPMAKGVVPDTHPLCVAAARSKALKDADVILLLGARLNWILHFGLPPKFNKNVKIIQADVLPEEHYQNSRIYVALLGHLPNVVSQLISTIQTTHFKYSIANSNIYQEGMGAFQELDQVTLCQPNTKYSARPTDPKQIPNIIDKAIKFSIYGRPGPVYVDLPANFIQATIDISSSSEAVSIKFPKGPIDPPKSLANTDDIIKAVQLLQNAKSPLIIIGKGASYSRAEKEINQLIEHTNIPFLPTPMAKGVVPDTHPLCVAAARSKALKDADVILLLGARLNWILHFGLPPKFNKNVKIIQADVLPEEHYQNSRIYVALLGHLPNVVSQLISTIQTTHFKYSIANSSYFQSLNKKINENITTVQKKFQDEKIPMSYHRAFWEIKKRLPKKNFVMVSEGANTMDIARSVFDLEEPRCRLDAGTFATMGVGIGFSIAAIVGDSAFGFSAMEIETVVRAQIPILIIVINNNGIYHGLDADSYAKIPINQLPSTALLPNLRYDLVADAFGGKGYFVKSPKELDNALEETISDESNSCIVINVMIEPGGNKKLEFAWMETTKSKL